MDDDSHTLEAELKKLRPVAPSARLAARLERDLANDRRTPPAARSGWCWAALPAAAAVALLMASVMMRDQPRRRGGTHPVELQPAALKPVAAENLLYAASDEGLVTLEDGTPARRARMSYVDTFVWENPRTHASLRWSVPREEVRVVPVVFQ